MEDAIRLIIIVLFIGLVVVSIVFFGVFFMAPLGKLSGVLGKKSTTTEVVSLPPLNQGAASNTIPAETVNPPANTSGSIPPPNPVSTGTMMENAPTSQSSEPTLQASDFKFINQTSQIPESDIPAGATKLTVTASGFSPTTITAQAGSVITLAVISGDNETHVFKFDNQALSSISIGVGPYGIRVLTFVINKTGIYGFHDDVPGRAQAGVVGRLVIN